MTDEEVLEELRRCGALLSGHFVLSSGRHSDRFLQLSVVLQDPRVAERLCAALADLWRRARVETVVGPALGGIIVAYETARALGARALFTEREEGRMRLLRGFALREGERVLVVDDVVTTGGSLRETIDAVVDAGAAVVGVGALAHREGKVGTGGVDFGVPYRPLARVAAVSYSPADCPLCSRGEPLTDPDKRTR